MHESFFAAQRRHRRSARLFSAVAAVPALVQSLPAALMLAPVCLGAAVLGADLLNLVTPVPDLLPEFAARWEAWTDPARREGGAVVALLAFGPGLVAMITLTLLVRRYVLRNGMAAALTGAGVRPADPADREERQLANLAAEMALAAGVRPPGVLVVDVPRSGAVVLGRSPDDAMIVVTRGLLDDLDRDATQGVVAHLVASAANGDLRMQHTVFGLSLAYSLAADLVCWPFARSSRRRVGLMVRLATGRADPQEQAGALGRLLDWDEDSNWVASFTMLTWRLMQMYLQLFLAGPFLALPLRARRHLADATAVQLTRNPDGLGRALIHLDRNGRLLPGAEITSLYGITGPRDAGESGSSDDALMIVVPTHPSLRRRIGRLRRLGLRHDLPVPPPADPSALQARVRAGFGGLPAGLQKLVAWVFGLVLGLVLVVLLLLLAVTVTAGILLSLMLGLFLFLALSAVVVLPLHAGLRALGG